MYISKLKKNNPTTFFHNNTGVGLSSTRKKRKGPNYSCWCSCRCYFSLFIFFLSLWTIGLDPAGGETVTFGLTEGSSRGQQCRLDISDAEFVDVIHTNAHGGLDGGYIGLQNEVVNDQEIEFL